MWVYISGPITGHDRDYARALFYRAARNVRDRGHLTVVPFDIKPQCGGCQGDGEHTWACLLRWDLAGLLRCEAIFLLSGWERSHGARLELQVAAACGLRVFHQLNDVPISATRPVPPPWFRGASNEQTIDTHGLT